jgi:hypothetical protein
MSWYRTIRLTLREPLAGAQVDPARSRGGDPRAVEAAGSRQGRAAAALHATFPDSLEGAPDHDRIQDWIAEGLTKKEARARFGGLALVNVGSAPAAQRIEVEIDDRSAVLTTTVYAHECAETLAALRADFARAAAVVAGATGFSASEAAADTPGGEGAAAVADAMAGKAIAHLRRDWLRGWAKFLAIQVLLIGCVAAAIWEGEAAKRVMTPAEPQSAYTFVVQDHAPVTRSWGRPPRFELIGAIRETGESATVDVLADAYRFARRGDSIGVLRGSHPDEPWLAPDRVTDFGPVLGLGRFAPAPLTIVGLAGAALWMAGLYWLYLRDPPVRRAHTRDASGGLLAAVVFAIGILPFGLFFGVL